MHQNYFRKQKSFATLNIFFLVFFVQSTQKISVTNLFQRRSCSLVYNSFVGLSSFFKSKTVVLVFQLLYKQEMYVRTYATTSKYFSLKGFLIFWVFLILRENGGSECKLFRLSFKLAFPCENLKLWVLSSRIVGS